jgi:6-phosphogluconolactonase
MSGNCGRMFKVKTFPDAISLTNAVISLLKEDMTRASEAKPHAIMLAGGSTPMAAYQAIAASPFPVSSELRVLFSDDRMALPDSPKSNYGNTLPMLKALGIPDDRVFRVHAEFPSTEAAAMYGRELGGFIEAGGRATLGFLGLGADGHTASLFSADHIRQAEGKWALAVKRPDGLEGVSATPRFIARVEKIIFLIAGKDKREMAHRLLKDSLSIPAGMAVAGNKSVEVWIDPAANPL